jgi:phosphoribosylanthranilate isomerase
MNAQSLNKWHGVLSTLYRRLIDVEVETALEIVNALPPFINRVGLFVNADSSFIDEVLCEVPLDTLQFHGDEALLLKASNNKPQDR